MVIDGAWKEWGYDLDKVCTSVDDSIKNVGTCRRVAGATPTRRRRTDNLAMGTLHLVRHGQAPIDWSLPPRAQMED